jgi:hypothetical protein
MDLPASEAWTPRPLRVGLLLDSYVQPRWVSDIVEELVRSEVASVVLVVLPDEDGPPRQSFRQRLVKVWPHLLYSLYSRADRRRHGRGADDPFAPTDVRRAIEGCVTLRLRPRKTRYCDFFEDADVEAIRAHRLDVALRFGFRILKGRALEIARFGVWSYHHADNLINRGSPPAFWEVMLGQPATGSVLQILTEELDGGKAIYRSWAQTDERSVWRTQANYYRKSAAFVMRKLRELHDEGPRALRDPLESAADWSGYSERLFTTPGNAEMAGLLGRLVGRYLRDKVSSWLFLDQWIVAYRLADPPGGEEGVPDRTLYRFRPLIPPRDRFWADPFPVQHGGRHFLFVEEWTYAQRKAHISVMELAADGRSFAPPVPVLQRPYHLSYPFVFRWKDEWYMVPETGGNRTVELYRASDFPYAWELDRVLLSDLHAVDATLAEVGGRWWMFANVAVPGASTVDELHLFHADTPHGPWRAHRRNPVKSDARNARPAGRLFSSQGRLYRPAQDCSVRYGYAVVVNRVERLDESEYREVEVSRLLPRWRPGIVGVHTLNAAGRLTVVDAWMKRPRLW